MMERFIAQVERDQKREAMWAALFTMLFMWVIYTFMAYIAWNWFLYPVLGWWVPLSWKGAFGLAMLIGVIRTLIGK